MKIAILMTVYATKEEWFRKAIESMLNQTHEDFTFYIVIDGPDEEAKSIIQGYKDIRVRIIEKEHEGQTAALNTGLSHIDADFIMRQDADDYSYHKRLELSLEAMADDVAVVGDNYGVVDANGVVLLYNNADPDKLPIDRLAGSVAGAGTLIRADVIRKVGGWKHKYAQDFYMWVSIRKLGWRIISLKHHLYFYRQHPKQISVALRDKQKECHRAIVEELFQKGGI